MNFFIKNMVGPRCKMIVEQEFEKIGLKCINIELGRVTITGDASAAQIMEAGLALSNYGLVLLDNKKNILVESIKRVIVDMITYSDSPLKTNFSDYLSTELNFDYTYLANIFSDVQGTTIEQFIILNKIQAVKQLIWQDELTLTEISWKLHYSSVAHLSAQFKKVTGVTPSHFKQVSFNDQKSA
ncbi:helix-turn-helix domain-containing protein [Mucilaginibacter flavidus]|uniref:helix-turn-helix domain-containing protein n=1 Tax=Mucilaginibacter flavidus TaxID=2949309 RepID=UPI0020928C65|nr:AraC family transcriptional regulator [Mucilaginibacter flavidus]MCO5947192.1 AraC family transcriptional regulator [Mucilaginibacter flavidus]